MFEGPPYIESDTGSSALSEDELKEFDMNCQLLGVNLQKSFLKCP